MDAAVAAAAGADGVGRRSGVGKAPPPRTGGRGAGSCTGCRAAAPVDATVAPDAAAAGPLASRPPSLSPSAAAAGASMSAVVAATKCASAGRVGSATCGDAPPPLPTRLRSARKTPRASTPDAAGRPSLESVICTSMSVSMPLPVAARRPPAAPAEAAGGARSSANPAWMRRTHASPAAGLTPGPLAESATARRRARTAARETGSSNAIAAANAAAVVDAA